MPGYKHCTSFNACDDRMSILKSEVVPRRLEDDDSIEEASWSHELGNNSYLFIDNDGKDKKVKLNDIMYAEQAQADWAQTDTEEKDYIKNKPDIDKLFNNLFLQDNFTTEVSYGDLPSDTILEKGTSLMEILLRMLQKSRNLEIRYGIWRSMGLEPQIYFGELGTGYEHKFITRDELLTQGLELSFNMNCGNSEETNGGYFWIAIPKNSQLKCTKLFQGGHAITKDEGLVETTPGDIPQRESFWLIYRLDTPVVPINNEPYHIIYKFGEVNINGAV